MAQQQHRNDKEINELEDQSRTVEIIPSKEDTGKERLKKKEHNNQWDDK